MINTKNLLTRERRLSPIISAVLVSCALTGIITYLFNMHSILMQWVVVFHLITGITCSFTLLPYLVTHFRRTIGFRRASLISSGLVILLIFALFTYTGWHILLSGRQENELWIYTLHVVSSIAFIVVIIIHIVLHIKWLPQKRKARGEDTLPSIPEHTHRSTIRFTAAIAIAIIGATSVYNWLSEPYTQSAMIEPYQYEYGQHPFRPSQTETASHSFIDERQIANSKQCANCHEDITRQWISSVHKEAASDPTYVTNVSLLSEKKGISATRYCEGCHAPVALLTGQLTPGGKHGGIDSTPANLEGISCMGCHGIVSLPHVKGVASYLFKPAQDYLFANSNYSFLTRINNLLINVKPEQHKADLGNPLLKKSKVCASCHSQFMDKEMNGWGWVKMQDEYSAWLKGPFSNHSDSQFSNATAKRCQDCHMPLMNTDDPSTDKNQQIRSHQFFGANTFLPILRGDQEQLDATVNFLQSNKLRVSIDKPKRQKTVQSGHSLDEKLRYYQEAPYYYYLNEKAAIKVVISNNGVGHDFPGGSIDINQAWVEFLVMDAAGDTIYSSGLINEENYVDPDAYFYRSLPVDRQGNLVWRHDLFNMVGESFKRVIKSGESDIVSYSFDIPAWARSPITISASLKYRKLNERYAKWALKDQYIKIPVINIAWDSLSIPVKIRKEVE